KWWTKEGIIINEEDYGKTQEIKGKKMIYSNIDSGDLIKKRTYFKDGVLEQQIEYKNGRESVKKTWNQKGGLMEEITYNE
ncbi:MAG: hypothetical protein GY754_36700, partial [bacterium]|nr:hypothetical protein [bacterium]